MSTRPEAPPARPPAARHGWSIGVVAVLLVIAYITVNTLRAGAGVTVRSGQQLPGFAVPRLFVEVPSDDQDANVSKRACAVTDPRALNICTYAAGHPLVLALASIKDEDSLRQLDAMQRVAHRLPRVRFAGVFLRGDRERARSEARRRGWTFALGWDHFGDVAAVYGARALPVIFLAGRGRRARAVEYRVLGGPELTRRLRRER